MANKAPATIFASRVGIALPTVKRGPKEQYPFDTLAAPAPVWQIEVEVDGKGKPKSDKDGNPIFVKNEDGTYKLALDTNGLPIPVNDADGKQVIQYDSFGIKDRSKKQVSSTIFTAESRYLGDPKTIKDAAGKDVPNKLREFAAFEVDPATDPDGATIRVFRIK